MRLSFAICKIYRTFAAKLQEDNEQKATLLHQFAGSHTASPIDTCRTREQWEQKFQSDTRPPEHHLHPGRRPWLGRPVMLWQPMHQNPKHRQTRRNRHTLHQQLRRIGHQLALPLLLDDRQEHRQHHHPRQHLHGRRAYRLQD